MKCKFLNQYSVFAATHNWLKESGNFFHGILLPCTSNLLGWKLSRKPNFTTLCWYILKDITYMNIYIHIYIYISQYDIYAMTIKVIDISQFFWIMHLVAWPWINESWWFEVYNWVPRVWWMIEVNDDGWIGLVWSYQQLESHQRTFRNLKPQKKGENVNHNYWSCTNNPTWLGSFSQRSGGN